MKKIIPFGSRILVKRRKVGDKLGSGILVSPETISDHSTEIADIIFIPDMTLADQELVNNAEKIIKALSDKITTGDSQALDALFKFKEYLNIRSLKVGDPVFISRYMQTDILIGENGQTVTLMDYSDIRGLIVESKIKKED